MHLPKLKYCRLSLWLEQDHKHGLEPEINVHLELLELTVFVFYEDVRSEYIYKACFRWFLLSARELRPNQELTDHLSCLRQVDGCCLRGYSRKVALVLGDVNIRHIVHVVIVDDLSSICLMLVTVDTLQGALILILGAFEEGCDLGYVDLVSWSL